LCHFRTGLISASVMLNNFFPDFFHGDIFADCQAALCNGLHGFVILNDFFHGDIFPHYRSRSARFPNKMNSAFFLS